MTQKYYDTYYVVRDTIWMVCWIALAVILISVAYVSIQVAF